jgi:Fungal specific transcription factor domain
MSGTFNPTYVNPTQMLDEAAVEYEDDDYYDVQSDEEVDVPPSQALVQAYETQRDFGMILALHRESTSELTMRRYDTFIYAGILDYYRAEWVASPLKNPKTARVFAHFIFATGPTLSIFERHPRNSSAIFDESPSPSSMQGLWTYTLPMMALSHQGLLHAMLALSSLHIAKLQHASITPSFKHYAYSLKRLRHCLSHPKKRHLPTTLAATLLLGFYEVMTADHLKWSSHLLGAKQLLVEMDYHLMAKEARKLKVQAKQEDQFNFGLLDGILAPTPVSPQGDSSIIDENLVSTIVDRKVKYDEFGQVMDESIVQKKPSDLPEPFDLSRYELYQDLFWWYAKQDAFQAIIGGNGLL